MQNYKTFAGFVQPVLLYGQLHQNVSSSKPWMLSCIKFLWLHWNYRSLGEYGGHCNCLILLFLTKTQIRGCSLLQILLWSLSECISELGLVMVSSGMVGFSSAMLSNQFPECHQGKYHQVLCITAKRYYWKSPVIMSRKMHIFDQIFSLLFLFHDTTQRK